MKQYEQNQVWTALEPDIASETAVLLSRPPQPLLEHFEAKTPVFTAFFNRSTDQPIFFNVVEVSECFWTVPGQSEGELPIFICP